ncbi:MAG: hypothetical protein EOO20_20070 [Chryseobacterium sp.]|nr:MAG: hypothetical protein EOO20_20070 [Chryseobacterium sp.]
MINYVIIIFTQSNSVKDLSIIDNTMMYFTSIIEWTQDLEDCDKVLRIVSSNDISIEILDRLHNFGISAKLMAVYLDANKKRLIASL